MIAAAKVERRKSRGQKGCADEIEDGRSEIEFLSSRSSSPMIGPLATMANFPLPSHHLDRSEHRSNADPRYRMAATMLARLDDKEAPVGDLRRFAEYTRATRLERAIAASESASRSRYPR